MPVAINSSAPSVNNTFESVEFTQILLDGLIQQRAVVGARGALPPEIAGVMFFRENHNTGGVTEYKIRAKTVFWPTIGALNLAFDPQYEQLSQNEVVLQNKPASWNAANDFDLVFFDLMKIKKILAYVSQQPNGSVRLRRAETDFAQPNAEYQTLVLEPVPPYNLPQNDRQAIAYEIGLSCPPTWRVPVAIRILSINNEEEVQTLSMEEIYKQADKPYPPVHATQPKVKLAQASKPKEKMRII